MLRPGLYGPLCSAESCRDRTLFRDVVERLRGSATPATPFLGGGWGEAASSGRVGVGVGVEGATATRFARRVEPVPEMAFLAKVRALL